MMGGGAVVFLSACCLLNAADDGWAWYLKKTMDPEQAMESRTRYQKSILRSHGWLNRFILDQNQTYLLRRGN
jgi:hypothetical protein